MCLPHLVVGFCILFIVDSASFSQAVFLVFTITEFLACVPYSVIALVAAASGYRGWLSPYRGKGHTSQVL